MHRILIDIDRIGKPLWIQFRGDDGKNKTRLGAYYIAYCRCGAKGV